MCSKNMQIKTITKLKNGDLVVRPHEGKPFHVSHKDELFQVFAVWAMLNPNGDTGRLRAL